MATYSNIGIKLITTGDESGTWGDTTNTNFSDILDEAIAGVVTYNIASDADVTLTVSDGSSSDGRHAVINFTSTTLSATRTVTFAPDTLQKTWVVINSTTGGQSLTFKQGSAGSTVTVANGKSAVIYSDGAGATNGAVKNALESFSNTSISTGLLDVDNVRIDSSTISSTDTNGNLVLAPNGTGDVQLDADTIRVGDSGVNATITSNGTADLILSTNGGTNSGTITIADGVNGNISITPNGTGSLSTTKLVASADSEFTSTGALTISKGTTGEQPGVPATGMLRYNTTTNQFEGYSGSSPSWKSVGGALTTNDTTTASDLYPAFLNQTTGTAENIYTSNAKLLYKPSTGEFKAAAPVASNGIFVNNTTVSESYTIASGTNGFSVGPLTQASGVTVTIVSGQRHVII